VGGKKWTERKRGRVQVRASANDGIVCNHFIVKYFSINHTVKSLKRIQFTPIPKPG
jgi:hypothetical protein